MVSHETKEGFIEFAQCPVCGSDHLKTVLEAESYRIPGNYFKISKCESCSHRFTNPIPDANGVSDYYNAENYISHTNSKKSLFDLVYGMVRKKALRDKSRLIEKKNANGFVLDFGCGTGSFLAHMVDRGWEGLGLEPSENARKNSQIEERIKDPGYLNKMDDASVDVITLWHVFEHLYNPGEILDEFSRVLKPGGSLYIAVPNPESLDAQQYREHWAAYDVPLHVSHFSKRSLRKLANDHGFEVKTILNMPFDAYYISLISEKNKHKTSKPLRAFLNGFASNRAARSKQNASSLIYLLEQKVSG